MKVFLHYEDNASPFLHKTLKITLPKSWKTGPTSKLLNQFVESYNASDLGKDNTLHASDLHLALKIDNTETTNNDHDKIQISPLASDAITNQVIDDRDAVYILHGPSQTLAQVESIQQAEIDRKTKELANTLACVHFGCKQRFPIGGPYPTCRYHIAPPVFHETAKFWSCCPNKKAYDWEDFQAIPGCQTGTCTNVKDDNHKDGKQFLGGCDLREAVGEAKKLKTIDDFNASEAAGGSHAAPVLERLRSVMAEIGVESELFDQVLDGIQKDVVGENNDEDALEYATKELGNKLKSAMKTIAVDQLRIK